MKTLKCAVIIAALTLASASQAATILYTQNFENPNLAAFNAGIYSTDGLGHPVDGSFNNVNNIYANQPAGFTFDQQYTVETLRIGGNLAWGGAGFLDPQGTAGQYAIGMLSSANNDLLGLSFNVGPYQFLNFQLDVSSIDLNFWGGTFKPSASVLPSFRISLYNNPTGTGNVGGGLTLLDFADITGVASASPNVFNWTNHVVGLNAAGSTNGNVTVVIDELTGGYAALDNFRIVAADVRGDVASVPEPATLTLLGLGLAGMGWSRRRKS